jgi:tellurite methyltransferase
MSDMRTKWNERWRERIDRPAEPDPWLCKVFPLLPGGKALDLASGKGRNALFLAEKGMSVTALDISEEALEQLAKEAGHRGLKVEILRIDLEADTRLPRDSFDVVLDFFFLYRPLFPQLLQAVRQGGVAVVRTFSRAGFFPGGPGNPEFVLHPGELLETFKGWEVLCHEEGLEPSRKGGSLAGIVARRPRNG